MTHRTATGLALALVLSGLLNSCAATTFDPSVTAADTVPPSTSALPAEGTAEELLPQLQLEVDGLAQRIWNEDHTAQSADRIEATWAAVRTDVENRWPGMVSDFEFVVRLCRTAADFRRPANADRAARNLATLVQATIG